MRPWPEYGRRRRAEPLLAAVLIGVLLLLLAGLPGHLRGSEPAPGEPSGAASVPGEPVQASPAPGLPADPVPAPVVADTLVEVRLVDGSVVLGRVLSETEARVVVETPAGVRVELERGQIRSMRPMQGRVVDGRFWREDPNRTRLFFAPTARPVARGEGYVASYMLFFPFVGYGLTERVSLAGGTPIFPGLIGEAFYLAPKVTVLERPGRALAVGAIALFATDELDEGSVGILYGTATFGESDRAVTLGAGWGFAVGGDDPFISSDPVLLLGGEIRAGQHTKIITENWFVVTGDAGGVATGGIRFFGERLSADLGIGLAAGDGGVSCCLPLVNFVYGFGIRR
jgi:hypothetical protein